MAMPTATCCATAPSASRPLRLMTGCSPSTPWAHSATRKARPIFARMGMERMENTGATVNTASTRKKGHRMGDSHPMIWASVKVITIQSSTGWTRWSGG